MPNWTNKLPETGKHMGFDLRRTPQSGSLHAIITCEDLLVCDTHFFHGRTMPCEREGDTIDPAMPSGNCPACREAIPFRTHVYVSAFDPRKREHFIFECTAHAAKPIAEHRDATGTTRGCIITASRPKGLKNSKVAIETNIANLAKVQLPEPPNIILALCTIWRVPAPAFAVAQQATSARANDERFDLGKNRVIAYADRLDAVRRQPDNMPDPILMGEIIPQVVGTNGKGKK